MEVEESDEGMEDQVENEKEMKMEVEGDDEGTADEGGNGKDLEVGVEDEVMGDPVKNEVVALDPHQRNASPSPPAEVLDKCYNKSRKKLQKAKRNFRSTEFEFSVEDAVLACPDELEPIGGLSIEELFRGCWIGIVKGIKDTVEQGVLVKLAWYA